ncbi:MAG: 5'-methylthioadenosine/S-adenosylhomocysteine nucleosidase [Chthoniobacteraceae bacterium]
MISSYPRQLSAMLPRLRWLMLLAFFLAAGCLQAHDPAGEYDATPRLAIISAFPPELQKLRNEAQITGERVINGRRHYVGKLAGHDVVLLLSGISMVNAAMTTQSLLDRFAVRQIIFSGIAGGVNPGLHVGDVTVPADWGQYQEQVFARKTADGWDQGPFPGEFPNYGMIFPHHVLVTRKDSEQPEKLFWFPADPEALKTVERIAGGIRLSGHTSDEKQLSHMPRVVVGGHGVSGSTFVNNTEYRQWVWQSFQANALDMETAAVATVAYVNRVPFIAFRSLSDLAGGGEGKNDLPVFLKLAAENSATVVLAYLNALPPAATAK